MKNKEPKPIDMKVWRKKAAKLKIKYTSYDELREDCRKIIGKDYFAIVDNSDNTIGDNILIDPVNVFDGGRTHDRVHVAKDVRTYMVKEDNSLELFDTAELIDKLADRLKDSIDRKMLMKDVLEDESLPMLLDLKERLFDEKTKKPKKAAISPSPKCFFISVGGKPGAPVNLFIRN